MPDILATNDGNINSNLAANYGGSWDACHDATRGGANSSQESTTFGMARIVVFVYAGYTRWIIHRTFMEFDTEDITVLPPEATLKIYGLGQIQTDVIAVKGTQSDSLTAHDYDNLDVSVPYSAEVATWTVLGFNDFSLNLAARQAMVDNDSFKVAIISYDNDYLDVDPGLPSVSINLGGYYSESATAAKRPYIDYTEGVTTPVSWTEMESKGGDIKIKGGRVVVGVDHDGPSSLPGNGGRSK